MPDETDMDLVREYVNRNSEAAFARLVQRHINMIYSVSLRFTGNSEDAQDVTQAVLVILAQKAGSLRQRAVLTGWLYETTRFVAIRFLRTKARREIREQKAYMQSTLNDSSSENVWRQLAPLLEEGMARLSEKERTLVAMRFFENKSAAESATLLGIQEWAAHKRAARAVEKLRLFFMNRGIVAPAAVLTAAIAANSVQAAPAALAKTATAVAIAKGATVSSSTLTLTKGALKIMAYKKAAMATAGVVVALLIGVTVSSPTARTAIMSMPQKIESHIPAMQRKAALMKQMETMKMSIWPALMKYSDEHNGKFPKSMDELRQYLPPGLSGMDDNHWRITAGNWTAKPTTPGLLTFCEQINQPAGQPRIILYADGHVEYRR